MTSLLQKLRRWVTTIRCHTGEEPAFMPLSREELFVIENPVDIHEIGLFTGSPHRRPAVFNLDTFDSPFAPEMRDMQVRMPIEEVCVADRVSEVTLNVKLETHRDPMLNEMHRRLVAYVCKDTTNLSVSFEFDPWAKFKLALRLTRWFPIRRKRVDISGRVLYPYLNITFPMNRHHVTFAVR